MTKTKKIIASLTVASAAIPVRAIAMSPDIQSAPTFAQILSNFLTWLMSIFGILALIAFVISGIMYLTSAGNQDRIELAKKSMTYAILGVIVGMAALIAVQVINKILTASSNI
jgi:type II secretory pathway component PulF